MPRQPAWCSTDTTGRDHKGLRTERNRGNREVDNWTALALNNIGPDILDGNVRNRRHRTARRRLQGASFDVNRTVGTRMERSVFMGEGVDDDIDPDEEPRYDRQPQDK